MHFELLLLICFVSLSSSAPTATPSRSTGEPLCRHNYSQWLQITSLQSQLASHSDGRLHVSQLSRRDITDLHVFFLETIQSVHFLMALISDRVCESIPPPHHHCFLPERDPTTVEYTFKEDSMHQEKLAADLCMLSDFIPALNSLLIYEKSHYGCDQNNAVQTILNVRTSVKLALEALSNFTGVAIPEHERPSEEEPTDCESGTEANANIPFDSDIAPASTASPPAVPTDLSDSELINQGGSGDTSSTSSHDRAHRSGNQETNSNINPTAPLDIPSRCLYPQSDEDQFVYVYELYQTLWYISIDLRAIKEKVSSS